MREKRKSEKIVKFIVKIFIHIPTHMYTPESKLPAHEIVPLPTSKYLQKSSRKIPNEYTIPSTIQLQKNDAMTMTFLFIEGSEWKLNEKKIINMRSVVVNQS